MEFLLFMLFSSVESLALIILVLAIYRFRLNECRRVAIFTSIVMALQSYLLRETLPLTDLVPFINAILISLLLTTVLLVPIHWSMFVALCGYVSFVVLQALLIEISFGWLEIEQLRVYPYKGYLLQLVTASLAILLARALYSRGYGFAFDFEAKRLKWEKGIVITMILATLGSFVFVFKANAAIIHLAVLSLAMAVFLYFSFKREATRD